MALGALRKDLFLPSFFSIEEVQSKNSHGLKFTSKTQTAFTKLGCITKP